MPLSYSPFFIVINEDIYIELLELLELYCELLIARFGLVEPKCVLSLDLYRPVPHQSFPVFSTREPDPAVSEGICSIIYAAPRTELKGA